ncbi:hypothetical protein FQN50_002305 [Emmonsiellopsis sp. PD_5]|nr:hypothetical protein FQN50_002305 [Emmonsiellopsis sp. PD_5]
MKFIHPLIGLLTFTPLALCRGPESWTCQTKSSKGSHDSLRKIHGKFNDIFGKGPLSLEIDQCYVAECEGAYFGICNWDPSTDTKNKKKIQENSGVRDKVKDMDPGANIQCDWLDSRAALYTYSVGEIPIIVNSTATNNDVPYILKKCAGP